MSELGTRNGRFHYHVVLYCEDDLRYRHLSHWDRGFGNYKLVDAGHAARYISKYLAKGHGKDARLLRVSGTQVPKEMSARSHVFVPLSELPRYEDTTPVDEDLSEERHVWIRYPK